MYALQKSSVRKRMEVIVLWTRKQPATMSFFFPVSYTHLDVYKRQLKNREQLTIKDPIIIVKKKIFASFPVIPILKLDTMYQRCV